MSTARELRETRDIRNNGFRRSRGVEITVVIGEANHGRRIPDIDVARVISGIEGDTEGMIKAGREVLEPLSFAIGADAPQDVNKARSRIGKKEVSIGSGADRPRLTEGSRSWQHVLGSSAALQRPIVTARIKGHLEARRSDG